MKNKKVGFGLLGIVALTMSGCAMTSGYSKGPDGKPVHWIDGMSASAAYEKANELCPNGYKILGEPRQASIVDYVMTVECK